MKQGLFTGEVEDEDSLIIKQARARHVLVEGDKNYGSGVLFASNLVISALHLVEGVKTIKVDKADARVIHTNRKQDLVALAVLTLPADCLVFDTEPTQRKRVGFHAAKKHHRSKHVHFLPYWGEISHAQHDSVYASTFTENGSCGSGLWSKEGLVGMVDSDVDFGGTQAVAGSVVKRFAMQAYKKLHSTRREETKVQVQERLPLPTSQPFQPKFVWT